MNIREQVTKHKGTEPPHSGSLLNLNDQGDYLCGQCGAKLFESDAKYDSTTPGLVGWPSFDRAIPGAVKELEDKSLGVQRTETVCAKCDSHLGHVFAANDAPSGTHYCINSASLDFCSPDGITIRGDTGERQE